MMGKSTKEKALKTGEICRAPVRLVRGVGPRRQADLERAGVRTIHDLLTFFPRAYEDRTRIASIAELTEGSFAVIKGKVSDLSHRRISAGRSFFKILLADDTGEIEALWFNQPYLKEQLAEGEQILLAGRVRESDKILQIISPDFEVLKKRKESVKDRGLFPIYPLSGDLTQGALRKLTRAVLDSHLDCLDDPLPFSIRDARNLIPLRDAVQRMHYPATAEELAEAKRRMKYEELFFLQYALAHHRRWLRQKRKSSSLSISKATEEWIHSLFSFSFTGAQQRVTREIREDLLSPYPMNRLLQGDVGSGKTAVAFFALLAVVRNGKQCALMVPTEVLAFQHHRLLQGMTEKDGVRVVLLTGSLSPRERSGCLKKIREGNADVVVGTHALIQENVAFRNLGLIVVDEQHKFGVQQRATLNAKGWNPDFLLLSATPIPRTLSMAFFGDLDMSVVNEVPPGRKPVETYAVPPGKEADAYAFIRDEIEKGAQAFVICPLVKGSEESDLRSAVNTAAVLSQKVYPDIPVGLLHGKMEREEKEKVMERFRSGTVRILVSTVVVEVGIDVPSARVMVVKEAHRFGLAQLHQLRGRIGRGGGTSYCFLFGTPETEEGQERIRILKGTNDGFRIAEEDVRLRGPGDFLGVRQHGLPALRVANMIQDLPILLEAKEDAFRVAEGRSNLDEESRDRLQKAFKLRFPKGTEFAGLG